MPSDDPISKAELLLNFGRRKEAARVLQEALLYDSHRADVRARLEEILNPPPTTIIATFHLYMSYVFVYGMVILFALVSNRLEPYGKSLDGLIGLITALLIIIALFIIAGYATLHLWFLYLKYVVRSYRPEVERRLPEFVRLDWIQPLYGKIRSRYFAESDT